MARALACKPSIIFTDEPTANLDRLSKSEVLDAIRSAKPAECAVVIVSHDVDVVSEHCGRIIRMENGIITEG
jgi:ABC-type glutathione transport system ATPase component